MPEDNRIIVLRRGILYGLNDIIELGGQFLPISILGERDMWKNIQKKEKKKKISEVINKIIPIRINFETFKVWHPWKVLSRVISRHHWKEFKINNINPKINNLFEDSWNNWIVPVSIIINLNEHIKGHGLRVTKWNGWEWDIFLYIICFFGVKSS